MTPQERMQELLQERKKIRNAIEDHILLHCAGVGALLSIASYYNWECEDSPIGICVYSDLEDPIHDFCLYCGQPEERK